MTRHSRASDVTMQHTVADALPFETVVMDRTGRIRWNNQAWTLFIENVLAHGPKSPNHPNYFDCLYFAISGQSGQRKFASIFDFVRLTDSPVAMNYKLRIQGNRWRHVYLQSLTIDGEDLILASHVDITDQKEREDVIRRMADVDGLTGLTNRRGLDTFLLDEFNRAQRINKPVSLLLIDVDHFKTYNDVHGHLAGDDVLRELAQELNKFGRRPTDLVARYGGEEFAIVLGNTDERGALAIARTAHRAIINLQLPFPEGTNGRVSVSIGVATAYPKKSSPPSGLMLAADNALYSAKRVGRDRIVVATLTL